MNLHHTSVIIEDCQRSEAFYRDVLLLEPSCERPDLGFSGLWYDFSNGSQLHLLQLKCQSSEKPLAQTASGRQSHFALSTSRFEQIIERLESKKIPFSKSRSGRKAIFFYDPDGNVIELIAK